ncbi:MAG: translation initiation factor IF-3 [Leptolyngbyaceae bacterium]|nr:translation initiation factor IF-3 [Leptolyngbyaceae bacterium]
MNKKQLVNRQIKSEQVLLIDHENNNRGLVDTREALQIAKDAKLDLVVVSERNDAPVAKIMDFGKHQYQQKKRQKHNARPSLKEVKFRPNIGDSDYARGVERATEWLDKGNMVKFQVRLRGREHQHRDRAAELLERVVNDLGEVGQVQSFDRRALVLQVAPS